jgi:hypothetical protein
MTGIQINLYLIDKRMVQVELIILVVLCHFQHVLLQIVCLLPFGPLQVHTRSACELLFLTFRRELFICHVN